MKLVIIDDQGEIHEVREDIEEVDLKRNFAQVDLCLDIDRTLVKISLERDAKAGKK